MAAPRPAYRILANGTDLSAVLAGRVKSISVRDAAGYESDTLEIDLSDHDADQPIEIPPTGAELEVWLGYTDDLQRMGVFVADEIELGGWPGHMTIRGRATPYEASKGGKSDMQTQKTRHWTKNTTLGAMVAKIAKEHGLESAVASGVRGIHLPQFDQTDESDISFLVRVCRKYDCVVKPGGGKLAVTKRGEGKTASGADMPTVILVDKDCSKWSMSITTRDSEGTVVAFYHDRGAALRKSVSVGSGDPVRRLRHNFPDQASAEKAAQGELDKRDRRKNKFSATMPGDPSLAAEGKLRVVGFRDGVPADWIITQVEHRFTTGVGYSCELEAELPNGSDD